VWAVCVLVGFGVLCLGESPGRSLGGVGGLCLGLECGCIHCCWSGGLLGFCWWWRSTLVCFVWLSVCRDPRVWWGCWVGDPLGGGGLACGLLVGGCSPLPGCLFWSLGVLEKAIPLWGSCLGVSVWGSLGLWFCLVLGGRYPLLGVFCCLGVSVWVVSVFTLRLGRLGGGCNPLEIPWACWCLGWVCGLLVVYPLSAGGGLSVACWPVGFCCCVLVGGLGESTGSSKIRKRLCLWCWCEIHLLVFLCPWVLGWESPFWEIPGAIFCAWLWCVWVLVVCLRAGGFLCWGCGGESTENPCRGSGLCLIPLLCCG